MGGEGVCQTESSNQAHQAVVFATLPRQSLRPTFRSIDRQINETATPLMLESGSQSAGGWVSGARTCSSKSGRSQLEVGEWLKPLEANFSRTCRHQSWTVQLGICPGIHLGTLGIGTSLFGSDLERKQSKATI